MYVHLNECYFVVQNIIILNNYNNNNIVTAEPIRQFSVCRRRRSVSRLSLLSLSGRPSGGGRVSRTAPPPAAVIPFVFIVTADIPPQPPPRLANRSPSAAAAVAGQVLPRNLPGRHIYRSLRARTMTPTRCCCCYYYCYYNTMRVPLTPTTLLSW